MVNNTFEERNQEARLRERERGRECWREKISLELKGVCGRVRRVALLHLNHFHLTSSAWADLGQQLLQNPGRGVYSCVEPLSKPGTLFVGFLSFRYLLSDDYNHEQVAALCEAPGCRAAKSAPGLCTRREHFRCQDSLRARWVSANPPTNDMIYGSLAPRCQSDTVMMTTR